MMAWVDDINRFAESVETNNQLSQSVTIGTTITGDAQAPSVPTGLKATASPSSEINLSWTASTDNVRVIGYKVFQNGSLAGTTTTTSYINKGVAANTSYTYTVAAYDAAGNTSGNSTAVTVKTSGTTTTNDSTVQGFAAATGVTGGTGGQNIVVTNLNESGTGSLKAAIDTSGTRNIKFQPGLSGVIKFTNVQYVPYDNMTIDGAGANITISGYSLSIFKPNGTPVKNMIIKNLRFMDTEPDRNAVNIKYGSYNIWVDHCTFRNNSRGTTGQGIAVWDRGLGLGGLTGITLSWNKFEAPNQKAILIASQNDSIHLSAKVSLHHNWFDNIYGRSPRLGAVTAHMWSNYISNWSEYGTAISGRGIC